MAFLSLYGGIGTPRGDYSGKAEAPVVEVSETYTGGFLPSYYKSEEEIRKERVRMGIIPDDLPEPLQEAIETIAQTQPKRRRYTQVAQAYETPKDDIKRLVSELAKAYAEIEAELQREFIDDANRIRAHLEFEIKRKQQNNVALMLLMLGSA